MANVNTNIRFYQPNDPYYWEVDNLPLTDLVTNDLLLQSRIESLETTLGVGAGKAATAGKDGESPGSFSTASLSDLKAFVEPLSGVGSRLGKVFVNPGRFTCRMQLPATRDSGWRMMRDKVVYFNNEYYLQVNQGSLPTTDVSPSVRQTQGVARTAVVEMLSEKSITLESFVDSDFNGGTAPSERVDLVYVQGSKSLDTDGDQPSTSPSFVQQGVIPETGLGVIKGAYFRTDSAAGINANGPRFVDGKSRSQGRITGMGIADMPNSSNYTKFGSVPMPEDLINYAWHANEDDGTQNLEFGLEWAAKQVTTAASFTLPVAYVKVPQGYQTGDPIDSANIVDIRPFLRSAELTYGERAAIAGSLDPNGFNPFITRNALNLELATTLEDYKYIRSSVERLESKADAAVHTVNGFNDRITILETNAGGGGGGLGATTEHWMPGSQSNTPFISQVTPQDVAGQEYILDNFVHAAHVYNTMYATFRIVWEDNANSQIAHRLTVENGVATPSYNIVSAYKFPLTNYQPQSETFSYPIGFGAGSSVKPKIKFSTFGNYGENVMSIYLESYVWQEVI